MELLLVIFQPDGVAPNDDIVVVGQLGELGVLGGNFKIKARGVFNRKRVVIKFSKNVYIFIVYFSHRSRQGFPFALGHCFYLYQLQQLVINSIQGKNKELAYFANKNINCVLTFSTRGFGFVIYNNVRIKS